MHWDEFPAKIEVEPSKLEGSILAPGSKSYTHRAIIAASLAKGVSIIHNPLFCEDTEVTVQMCQKMGAQIVKVGNNLEVEGFGDSPSLPGTIDMGEAGTSFRLAMGLCSWLKGGTLLTTPKTSTLAQRTSGELVKALESLGAVIEGGDKLPMVIKGGIKGGKVEISGKSSQYISSLLMIGPVLDKGIDVTITDNLNSKPYLEMTIEVMEKAGIKVKANKDFTQFGVKPSEYKPFEFTVPGDYSSAAPIMCAALATWSEISIYGLKEDKQGDRVVIKALKEMGGQITGGDELKIKPAELHGIELDGRSTPDIIPPLAALASMCSGESRFYNISHLRNKESDRISDLATELKKIGAGVKEKPDELKILPGSMKHAHINPHNDHRIAMALTVVGLGGKGIRLNDPSCVLKSYPTFFRDLEILGANIHP